MNAILALQQHRERHQRIDALEAGLLDQPVELRAQFEPEIFHHFAPGLYAREMRIRAGACITSKIHKFPGLSILSRGSMALYMPDGSAQIVYAGFHIVAPAGTRRAAYVLEDAVWTCMHPTELTDVDLIEHHFIARDMAEFIAWARDQQQLPAQAEGETPCLGQQ